VRNNIALFPDAPTKRGARHVREIIENNGNILFLVFRKAKTFVPNWEMDPKFSSNLSEARRKGIKIIPVQISFDGETIYFEKKIPLSDF
ncbi:MAG: DNA/RNA nuclease SfsA, partial [Candidatus Hermodarchaeota archaeon]